MKKLIYALTIVGIMSPMSSALAAKKQFFSLKSFTRKNLRVTQAPSLFMVRSAYQNEYAPPPAPAAEGSDPVLMPASKAMKHSNSVKLFPCVEYKDLHNIHPCAVPKIVAVKDPKQCYNTCNCCTPGCVYVKICVPPCGCAKVKCSRNGKKVKYDYGKYEVEIKSKNGIVYVDYDD